MSRQSKAALSALKAHLKQIEALAQVSGLMGWDQETMMPKAAAAQRSEQFGAMETVLHGLRTDPRMGDWFDAIRRDSLTKVEAALLRRAEKSFARNTRIPADLASEIAATTSTAQGIWAEARENDDFASFKLALAYVIDLRRQEAAALSDEGDLYEALLEDYEPGMKVDDLAALLGGLRAGLVDLHQRLASSSADIPELEGRFAPKQQMLIARELAEAFGYDWTRGRLDFSVHPFSSGSQNDVRITTRISESDPFNCFYSTIHEVGHARYEQNIAPELGLTPLGSGVSMGVHESQSRIVENQLGRSRAFTGHLYRRMREVFGDFGIPSEQVFYKCVNKLREGYIRTEADEVQYNLHVLMRFDLERALLSGDLQVDDLEAAWNDRFQTDFGFAVDRPSNGVLQDVHWSVGLIGYFPTYSLGNIYAGELFARLRNALPGLDQDLASGNAIEAVNWLKDVIHQHGGIYEPQDLMQRAVGHVPSETPLLRYLDEKFTAIYAQGV